MPRTFNLAQAELIRVTKNFMKDGDSIAVKPFVLQSITDELYFNKYELGIHPDATFWSGDSDNLYRNSNVGIQNAGDFSNVLTVGTKTFFTGGGDIVTLSNVESTAGYFKGDGGGLTNVTAKPSISNDTVNVLKTHSKLSTSGTYAVGDGTTEGQEHTIFTVGTPTITLTGNLRGSELTFTGGVKQLVWLGSEWSII